LLGVTPENGRQQCLEAEHGGARREEDGDIEWCREGILLLSREWSVFLPCCMLFPTSFYGFYIFTLYFPAATFSCFLFLPFSLLPVSPYSSVRMVSVSAASSSHVQQNQQKKA
jgi:hypothetical protein